MVFIDEAWAKTNMIRTHGWYTKGEPLIDKPGLSFAEGGSQVCKLLKAAGIRLFFLPPCSPDLHPIEEMFAKLKRLLRKANERTVEATWRRIGKLQNRFPPAECANYIREAGYAST
jgi:hypothetical protein